MLTHRRARRKFAQAALVLALLAIATAAGCADWFILPPAPKSSNTGGAQRRTFAYSGGVGEAYIERSSGALHGDPQAFVLRFTGGDAPGAAAFTAQRWGVRPVEVWCVNYPGYGNS